MQVGFVKSSEMVGSNRMPVFNNKCLRLAKLNDQSNLLTNDVGDYIFINHENINTVRKLMYAFANGDVDKAFSFFTKNATYIDLTNQKE